MKRYLSLWIVAILGGALTTLAVLAVPSWWGVRGVVLSGAATNDFSAVNLGQLKNMASNAYNELEVGFSGVGGAGSAISNLVHSFSNVDNYAVANLGQLKAVAEPFYDRLIEVGMAIDYPWTAATNDDSDYSVANIGQLKNVFSFDISADADGDGLTSGEEVNEYGTAPLDIDSDNDGLLDGYDIVVYWEDSRYELWANAGISYIEDTGLRTFKGELSAGSDPLDDDSDADGLLDGWEVQNELDPLDGEGDNGPEGDPDDDGFDNTQEFELGAPANNAAWNGNELAYRLTHAHSVIVTNARTITTNLIGMRVTVTNSWDCETGGHHGIQNNTDHLVVSNLLDPGYFIDITVTGSVEDVDAYYDKVYFEAFTNAFYFMSHDGVDDDEEEEDCYMVDEGATCNNLILANSTVYLRYDTVGYKWHMNAYAEIMAATNTGVLKVDLGIDVDDDGDVDDADEVKEESPGAIIFENWDNDDGDVAHTPDKDETSVTGENDLIPIYPKLEPTLNTGTLKLEATAGGSRVKVWTSATKGAEITLPKTWNLATETVPATLYLEGYDESVSANDIELKLSYANGGSPICDDILKVTVVRQNLGVASYRALVSSIIIWLGGDFNHTGLITGYTGKRTKSALTNDANWVIIEMNGSACVQTTLQAHKAAAAPFHGFYSVNNLTDAQRNNVVTNGWLCLADGTIGYTWADAVDGDGIGLNWDGTIGDIDQLRCDGLVEVCYELANVEVWGRNGAHYLIQNFAEEHNDFGMNEPQTELCPIVQRGGVTNSPTHFISATLFQPQTLP